VSLSGKIALLPDWVFRSKYTSLPERSPNSKGGTLNVLGDKNPFACNNCLDNNANAKID